MPQAYELVPGWEKLPGEIAHLDCAGVSVDSADNVYIVTRREPRVIVYSRDGRYLRSWGEELFSERPHSITVDRKDFVYVVDEGSHCIYTFSTDGAQYKTIGTPHSPSDTGYDGTRASIKGGPPFNRPTYVAISNQDTLYVTDGYGNCRIHHLAESGELLGSRGEPGSGAGQFVLPHGVAIDSDGNILVADRENDRIQIFDPDLNFVMEWSDVQRPTSVAVDGGGRIYVSELAWRKGDRSPTRGVILADLPCRVSIFDADRDLLTRLGHDCPVPHNFVAVHDVAVDSWGDIYVAEVTYSFATSKGHASSDGPTLHKFALRR